MIFLLQEFDISEDSGKRQKTDFPPGSDTNKRTRDDSSPTLDNLTSTSKPVSKRVCMYDEYTASCSSTIHSLHKLNDQGSKRKSASTSKN